MADRKVQLKRNNDNLYPKTVMENVYDVQPNGTKVPLVDIVNTLIDQDEDMDARIDKFEKGINVGANKVVSANGGYTMDADSAAKLKTPRRIALMNGASGYADFDGTSNISIPVTAISSQYVQEPPRSAITPTTMPLVDYTRANKLAFLPADQIIIEKTTDGGTTWTDAGVSDAVKMKIFSDVRQESLLIPLKNGIKSTDCAIRVTITGMKYNVPAGTAECDKYNYWNKSYVTASERYVYISGLYVWVTANSDRIYCKIESAKGSDTNVWTARFTSTNINEALAGWPGGNYLSFSDCTFGGGITQYGNDWNWRITFRTCAVDTSFDDSKLNKVSPTYQQFVTSVNGYGVGTYSVSGDNNMAKTGHLYSWDYLKNATFPNCVTSTKFVKEGGTATQFLKANGDIDSTVYQPKIDGSFATTAKTVTGAINEVKTKADVNASSISSMGTEIGKKLNTTDFNASMGANNGICPLDSSGVVSSQYLPGYVDDVVELDSFVTAKPNAGGWYYNSSTKKVEEYGEVMPGLTELIKSDTPESGKIYVNLADNRVYRWSGSAMVVISDTIALGETSATAFRGDRGKAVYDWYGRTDSNGNTNAERLNNLPAYVCGAGGEYPNNPFILNATATSATVYLRYISIGDGIDRMGDYSFTIPASSSTSAGLMTAAQYNKLNGVKEKLVYDFDKIMVLANNSSGAAAQIAWTPIGKSSPILPTKDNMQIYDFEFIGQYHVGHMVSVLDESYGQGYIYFTILYNGYDGAYLMYMGVDLGASYYTEKTVKKLV